MKQLYRIDLINTDNGWDNVSTFYVEDEAFYNEVSDKYTVDSNIYEKLEGLEICCPTFPFILMGDTKKVLER